MKMDSSLKITLSLSFLVCINSKPASDEILKYENNLRNDGYDLVLKTKDGFSKNENATIDESGKLEVEGDYFMRFPKTNQFIYVTYTSGTKGFLPHVTFGIRIAKSDRIPTAAIASIAGGGLG